jgi:hypothetical protein
MTRRRTNDHPQPCRPQLPAGGAEMSIFWCALFIGGCAMCFAHASVWVAEPRERWHGVLFWLFWAASAARCAYNLGWLP